MFALPKAAWYEFQSPRRWGGGLGRSDDTSTASPGGIVSIPSEWGGVGLITAILETRRPV